MSCIARLKLYQNFSMNLKEKYTHHKTEFDESAWQQFVELKQKNIANKKNNQSNIMKIILLLSIIISSVIGAEQYFNLGQKNSLAQEQTTVQLNESSKTAPSIELKSTLSASQKGRKLNEQTNQNKFATEKSKPPKANHNSIKTIDSSAPLNLATNQNANQPKTIEKKIKNIKPKQTADLTTIKVIAQSANENTQKAPPINNNNQTARNHNNETKIERPDDLITNLPNLSSKGVVKLNDKSNSPDENSNSSTFNKLQINPSFSPKLSLSNKVNEPSSNSISPLTKISGVLNQEIQNLAKRDQPNNIDYKNIWRFGFNYTFLYINGYVANGNQVKKNGYFFETDYRRKLNKILSVGAGFGFSRAEDRNNQQLEEVDFETNIHLHLRAYLFLLSKPNNRIFIKGGTGFSHTERLHSFPIGSISGETRGLQYSKYNYLGWSFEAAYERNITENILLGIQTGISSGNDGFTYTGLSLGYLF